MMADLGLRSSWEERDAAKVDVGGCASVNARGVTFVRLETLCQNQRTAYESEGSVSSTLTWTYEPQNGGTKVTVENECTVHLPALRKLAESFLTRINENEAEAVLANVKAKMEA
ncbi:MAG: hypothetical protein PVH80_08095 [Anaerolineae bacterium]